MDTSGRKAERCKVISHQEQNESTFYSNGTNLPPGGHLAMSHSLLSQLRGPECYWQVLTWLRTTSQQQRIIWSKMSISAKNSRNPDLKQVSIDQGNGQPEKTSETGESQKPTSAETICYGLNCVPSPKSYVEILTFNNPEYDLIWK